jgi:hypothetical protein
MTWNGYRLEILHASQVDISPGMSSLSNSGLDFNARMNHGFQALLEIAESVIPDTCRSKLLKACRKYGFTGLFLVSRSQFVW